MANTYILSSNTSDFTSTVKEGSIMLDHNKKYEAALLSLDMYNTIPNIIEGKNNIFKYYNGTDWKTISILTGSYELTEINNEIQRQMVANGDYDHGDGNGINPPSYDLYFITITANVSRSTSIINITHKNYCIDFNIENSIGKVLGYNVGDPILRYGYNESPNKVDIIHINSIFVNIDIIQGSYVDHVLSSIIYSFYPKVPFGYKIIERPSPLVWYPVETYNLSRMRLWLTDQDHNPLETSGERLTVKIQIKEVKNLKNSIIEHGTI